MPAFTATLTDFIFDADEFRKEMDFRIRSQLKLAATKFLGAAVPKVPFRTGFVRGAFTKLADAVGVNYGPRTDSLVREASKQQKTVDYLTKKIKTFKEAGKNQYFEKALLRVKLTQDSAKRSIARLEKTIALYMHKGVITEKQSLSIKNIQRRQAFFQKKFDRAESIRQSINNKELQEKAKKTLSKYKAMLKNAESRLAKATKKIQDLKLGELLVLREQAKRSSQTGQSPVAAKRKGPSQTARQLNKIGYFEYYKPKIGPKVLKTLRSGRDFAVVTIDGKTVEKVVTKNFTKQTEKKYLYNFEFSIDIDYFNINDAFSNSKTPSSPWKSFEAGKKAFIDYMNKQGIEALKRFEVSAFMLEAIRYVSPGGSIIKTTKRLIVR